MNQIITTLTSNHDIAMQTHFVEADLTYAWQSAGEPDSFTHIIDVSNMPSDDQVDKLMHRLDWIRDNVPFKVDFAVVTKAHPQPHNYTRIYNSLDEAQDAIS